MFHYVLKCFNIPVARFVTSLIFALYCNKKNIVIVGSPMVKESYQNGKKINAPIFMAIGDADGVRYEHAPELFGLKAGEKWVI